MDVDLDTFLTEVYVTLDTWCAAHPSPRRRGPHPRMGDAEVLTVWLVGQWRGSSERGLVRYATTHLRPWFPVLLTPSAFNRRLRQLTGRVVALLHDLAATLKVWDDAYEIVDCMPVPVAQRVRGTRRRCFPAEQAAVGRGGVGRGFYYGVSLLLSVSARGVITGFVTAPAPMGERWLLGALLSWRADPTALPMDDAALPPAGHGRSRVGPVGDRLSPATAGPPIHGVYLADQGFRGQAWQQYWRTVLRATVWTHNQLPPPLVHWFHHARQVIETVIGHLTTTFHLRYPQARTAHGLITRIAGKCAALNLGILLNRRYDRPDLALRTVFPG